MDDRLAVDVLARALTHCQRDEVNGALHLLGSPGGVVHLRGGSVVAVHTPGAPGADALLLRSGRVTEDEWTAALRARVQERSHRAEQLAPGRIGSTELQISAIMAALDGAFAIVVGSVEDCVINRQPVDLVLTIELGVDRDWLLRETTRRLAALRSLPCRVSPYRDRVAAVPRGTLSETRLTPSWREILAQANGRRSARDIAFVLGRGVYSVTVEISRMLSDGLLEVVSGTVMGTGPPGRSAAPRAPTPARGDPDTIPALSPLPQRVPGQSGIASIMNRSTARSTAPSPAPTETPPDRQSERQPEIPSDRPPEIPSDSRPEIPSTDEPWAPNRQWSPRAARLFNRIRSALPATEPNVHNRKEQQE